MKPFEKLKTDLEKITSFKEQLIILIKQQPSNYKKYLENEKFGFKYLKVWIDKQLPVLNDTIYELKTKIFWILNDLKDFPKCVICGKPLKNINIYSVQQGYKRLCCSKKCVFTNAANERKKQLQEKYGITSIFQLESVKNKIKQINIEKYGNACPANSENIRSKIKNENLKKYGVENYSTTTECREKVKNTNLKKYNVESTFQSGKLREKAKQTNLERYGVEYASQSAEIKQKIKNSYIEKYGENYKTEIWGKKGNIGQSKRAYNDYILKSTYVEPLFSIQEYVDARLNNLNNFKFKCKKCSKTFMSYWDNGATKSCPYCQITATKTSKAEQRLYTYILDIANNNFKVKHNDRTVLTDFELDVYIPEKKLAFEFDGLYWHNSDIQPNYKYHLNKTELCEKQGIQLIHIFENEWNFNTNIVKSRIKNLLGIYDKTIFARKCAIKIVDSNISKQFQEDNHIQGAVNAKVNLGLYYNDALISLMTFGKCRFDKKHEWELLRFCNKLGYHIPGAAGKLLKHFERTYQPKSLVSYADRRWSQGKLYNALGFRLNHISAPNYWYFKSYTAKYLESRVKYQKHKLKNILVQFDETKTEVENMLYNGYHRIFDCGNLVFEKIY